MIWSEWCDTEYNTLGLYSDGYDIILGEEPEKQYIYTQDWEDGLANSPIIEIILID